MQAAILIVEDSDDVRELLAELLMREGYHAIMARNGREALVQMQSVQPDLVITDLKMPDIGGVELIVSMKAEPGLARVPVILLSAWNSELVVPELEAAQVMPARIMTKPVDLQELLQALVDLLNPT